MFYTAGNQLSSKDDPDGSTAAGSLLWYREPLLSVDSGLSHSSRDPGTALHSRDPFTQRRQRNLHKSANPVNMKSRQFLTIFISLFLPPQLDGSTESKDDLGDIDSILERIESSNGVTFQGQSTGNTDSRPLLYVEHR